MKKRIISLLICLAVAATTLLGMAWADLLPTGLFVRYAAVTGQQETVSYVVGAGQTQVRSNQCTILEASDTGIQMDAGWYAVKAGNLTIDGDIKTTGDVHIVLCDYANLVVNGSLLTQGGGSVSIYAQTFDQVGKTGCMTVDSTRASAFERQSGDPDPAKLCIYGGKIQAKGSQRAMDKNYLVQVGDGTEKACQTTPLRCTLVADETILPADQWMGSSDFDANNIYFRRCDHTQGMYLYTPTDSTHHIETCESCNYRPGGFGHIAVCAFHEHECILDANGNSTDRHTNKCYCGNVGDPAESACVFSEDYHWLDTKYHGHKCQYCLGISQLQAHTFADGSCTVCGENCPHQVDENGKCTICGEQYQAVVIQDGDEGEYEYYYFADFTDALYACDGATLKLLADAAVDSGLTLPEQSYICLDLGGKTLTVTPDEDGQAYLLLGNNANLELTGSGAIRGELRLQDGGSLDTQETFTGSINAVTVDDTAFMLTLSGHIGTLTLDYTQQPDSYISLLSLYGGTFDKIVSNYKDAQGDPILDLPLSRLLQPGYALRYTADGKLAPVAGTGIGTGISGVKVERCTHDGSTAAQCPYCGLTHVAEARGTKYYTLQDALDAVKNNGNMVTILDDIGIGAIPVLLSENSSNRITLDLNGHTVSDLSVGSTDYDHEKREAFVTGTGYAWITDSVGGGKLKNVSVYSGYLILDGAAIEEMYCYDQATIYSGSVTELTAGKLNASAPGARVVAEKVGDNDNMIQNAAWRVRDAESSLLLKWGFFDSLFIDNLGSVEIQRGIFNCIESRKDGNSYPLRSIISSKSAFYTDPDGTGAFGKIYFLTDEAKLENVILGNDHEHEFPDSTATDCPCGLHCDHEIDDTTGLCSLCGAQFSTKVTHDGTATYYPGTLRDAFDKAQNGDTVTLVSDGLETTAVISDGRTLTLDFNGKTLKPNGVGIILGDSGDATKSGHLILTGSGGTEELPSAYYQSIWMTGPSTLQTKDFTGYIGKLAVHGSDAGGQLSGGAYGIISRSGSGSGILGRFLAPGYAFQYTGENGTYLPYNTPLEGWPGVTHIWNVRVVECPHGEIKNGACTYCNAAIVASIQGDSGEVYYSDFNAGLEDARMMGRTLKLYANYAYTTPLDLTGGTVSIDLNGYKIAPADGVTEKLNLNSGTAAMALTIQDSSENASGSIGPLQVTKGSLILQSGWLNGLTVSAYNTEANISLHQGGLCGETSVSGPLIPLLQKGSYIVDDRGVVSISDPGVIEPNVNYTIAPAPVSDLKIGYKGQVPLGRQNVPLELSFAPVGEAAAVYTVTWYWMGADYLDLTSTTLTDQDGRLVYDTSYTDTVHLQPGLQGFSNLDLGDTIQVCAKVTSWDAEKNALWQTWFAHDEGSLLEITNPNLSLADINLDQALTFQPYNFGQSSQGTELIQPITVTYFGKTLTEGTDYVVEGNTGTNAGDYTLTIRPAEGSEYLDEKSAPWTIAQHPLGDMSGINAFRDYDGTTDPDLSDANFRSKANQSGIDSVNLVPGEDYAIVSITSTGFTDANVGSSGTYTITVRLTNPNYIFDDGKDTRTCTFQQRINYGYLPATATLTPGTLAVSNNHEKVYTFDLKTLLPTLPENMTFGGLTYALEDYVYRPYDDQVDFTSLKALDLDSRYYTDGAAVSEDGILTLPISAVETDVEGSIGTVNVEVSSGNFVSFPLTVELTAKNKQVPAGEPTLSATNIDYGQTLSDIEITGTMKVGETVVPGTFTWNEPNLVLSAGGWNAPWTFAPDNTDDYEIVPGSALITVNKVEVTVTAPTANTLTYTGQAQTLLTAGTAKGGQMVYSLDLNGTYTYTIPTGTTAGSYTVWYKVDPDSNHTGTQPEPVTVTIAQAKAPASTQGSLTVVNERAETLTLDLAKLLPTLAEGCDFGTVTYGDPTVKLTRGYYTEGAAVDVKGLLTLPVNAVNSTKEGAVGTVTVTVTTTNYEAFTLTVNVSARNKGIPAGEPSFSTTTIDFGQKIGDIAISGTMQVGETVIPGTFTWDAPETTPNAGTYTAAWTFTPKDTDEYKVVHGTVTITVSKVPVTVTAPRANALTYTGKAQTLLTAGSAVGGQMVYSLDSDGTYAAAIPTGTNAATYTVYYKVLGDANHNDTRPESLTVTIGTKALTASDVTVSTPANVPYNGQSHRWTPEITFGGATLEQGRDYTVAYDKDDFTNVTGDITVTVTGAGNFSGTVQRTYAVTARPMDDVTVVLEDLTYTGAVQMPRIVSVTVDGYTLAEGTDYTATLKDAVFAGNYPLTLTGLGNFTGTTQRTLTIARADALTVAPIRVDVTNGYATAYTVDLRAALNAVLPKGCRFGAVQYGGLNFTDDKGYCDVVASNISAQGVLTLAVNAVSTTQEGLVATVRVTVETGNYQPMNDGKAEALRLLDKLPAQAEDGTYYVDAQTGAIHIFAASFDTYAIGYTPEPVDPGAATGDAGLVVYTLLAVAACAGAAGMATRRRKRG